MQCVFVIEDDLRFDAQIKDAIKSADPRIFIHTFASLEGLLGWIKEAVSKGQDAFQVLDPELKGKKCELRLIVSKIEFLGAKHFRLLQRTRDFLIEKGLCSKEDPTAFVATAFDSPAFKIHEFEDKIVHNLIFKPFDRLILVQDLAYALAGRHPLNKEQIHSMKTHAQIEMLKDAEMIELSDIGFKTRNNHTIPVGSIAKYYGEIFTVGSDVSIYGRCTDCRPEPGHEGYFICEFLFFSLSRAQTLNLRKKIPLAGAPKTKSEKVENYKLVNIVIANNEMGFASGLADSLADFSKSIRTFEAPGLLDLVKPEIIKDIPNQIDILVYAVAKSDFGANLTNTLKGVSEALAGRNAKLGINSQPPKIFLVSDGFPADGERRVLASLVEEFLPYPIERGYLKFRLNHMLEGLLTKQENFPSAQWISALSQIKVANPVEVSQLSEAGLVLKYYRPIGVGSFREFILWRSQEKETPVIVGNCNFVEQDKADRKHQLCHFVFFGMNDTSLKHIRLWIRENYVHEKLAKGA